MISNLLENIINNFYWSYMITVNVLTYMIIKIIDYINKEKQVTNLIKRICLLLSIIGLGFTYKLIGDIDNIILLNSAILAPVSWDFIFRPIIKKLGFGYKNSHDDSENHLNTELNK